MDTTTRFIKVFSEAAASNSPHSVFEAFVSDFAMLFANGSPGDFMWLSDHRDATLGGLDDAATSRFGELRDIVVDAYESNPEQDVLGSAYMELGLGNARAGQYFTPYEASKMMASVAIEDGSLKEKLATQGVVVIGDPTAGSGSMLIACANRLRELGVNYQRNAVFEAREIDRLIALMCYVQMSLLGMPGLVVIGDSLKNSASRVMYTPLINPSPALMYQIARRFSPEATPVQA